MNNDPDLKFKRCEKAVCALILSAAFLLCTNLPVNTYSDNDKIAALEQKIKEKKEEKEKTESKINENKKEISALTDTANSLKGELNSLNYELSEVSDNLERIEGEIDRKNIEIEQMEEELAEAILIENEQYEAMKIRIKYMYEKKNYAVLDGLFGAADFGEFLNRADYFEAVASYDRRKLEEFRHTRAVVEEAKEMLLDEKEKLDELENEAGEEQGRVSGLVKKTTSSINAYQNEIASTEKELAERQEELEAQKADLASLQAELAEERRLSALAAKSAWRDISEVSFAEDDRYLLANLIYCEAGNQPYEGQVAVGAVVINRVLSSVFPSTVVGVIYQKKQFSPVASGRLAMALANNSATPACYSAADAAMSGQTTVGNCLFFRTPIEGLTGIQIGGHIFY